MTAPSPIITIDGQSYFVRRPTGESPNLWQFDPTSETWEDATKVRDLPVGFNAQDVADAIAYSQRTDKPNLDTEAARLV